MSQMTADVQAFLEAVGTGNMEAIKQMVQATPALLQLNEKTGASPVLTAIYNGQQEALNFLLEQNVTLDVFEAAAVGKLERVQELVEQEPERVLAFRSDGFTALGLAAFLGHLPVVELLLDKGADVNSVARNAMQVMPLHSAVATRQLAIAERLLQHGAQVNAAQQKGWTPLHEAALHGQEPMVSLLLSHGADVQVKNDDGETPLALAVKRGHEVVAELLRKHGAVE